MTDNYSLTPQIHGLFGEHVSVRLDFVTVERPNGSDPVNRMVLVLEITQPEGPTVRVLLDEGSANTLADTVMDHLGPLRHPELVERIRQAQAVKLDWRALTKGSEDEA